MSKSEIDKIKEIAEKLLKSTYYYGIEVEKLARAYLELEKEITKLKEENEKLKQLFAVQLDLIEQNEKLKKSREALRSTLEEISTEQEFYIKTKDYFSEIVRLNLEAREAIKADDEIMGGK